MLKSIYYRLLFLYNYVKYRNDKVRLPMLEVWVGQACSLKCEHCCHLIPYVKPRLYNIDALINECERVLKICDIEYFSIVGGEPFTNKNLYKLLNRISEISGITKGKIVTNGTIIPDEKTINALKQLNGKLELHIDCYPCQTEKTYQFYQCMIDNNIPCVMTDYDKWEWKKLGIPGKIGIQGAFITQNRFTGCWNKRCYTLADGMFVCCPRGITTSEVFHQRQREFEFCMIKELDDRRAKALIATSMDQYLYKDFCRYCFGMTKKNKTSEVPGRQK